MTREDLLTLDEVAQLLGVSYWSARGFLDRGELRKLRIGGRVYVTRRDAEKLAKKYLAGGSRG